MDESLRDRHMSPTTTRTTATVFMSVLWNVLFLLPVYLFFTTQFKRGLAPHSSVSVESEMTVVMMVFVSDWRNTVKQVKNIDDDKNAVRKWCTHNSLNTQRWFPFYLLKSSYECEPWYQWNNIKGMPWVRPAGARKHWCLSLLNPIQFLHLLHVSASG